MSKASSAVALVLLFSVQGFREKRRSSAACGVKGVSASGGNESSIAIVNGEVAGECEWKWQVGLWTSAGKLPFCGGMLIADDWVLTAAHCQANTNTYVVAGDWKAKETSANEQRRSVAEVITHPTYNKYWQGSWDFALIRLSTPMQLNKCVGTICLPRGGDAAPGTKCWISGWGTLASGSRQSEVLQEAPVTTISTTDCVSKYSYRAYQITAPMFCAQGRDSKGRVTDACQGDSGGPLVCETEGGWTLYGATSWGWGCGQAEYPGVWARVHSALDWIDATMQ